MKPVEMQNVCTYANDGVRAGSVRLGGEPGESVVACLVEDVTEFFDFAPDESLERSGNATQRTHRVGDIPEYERPRLIARIHVAVEFLGIAGTREGGDGLLSVYARPDEQKLGIASKVTEF